MLQRLKNILIGEPLTQDNSGDDHLLSKVQALAMLSSDRIGVDGCIKRCYLVVYPYWGFGFSPFG